MRGREGDPGEEVSMADSGPAVCCSSSNTGVSVPKPAGPCLRKFIQVTVGRD